MSTSELIDAIQADIKSIDDATPRGALDAVGKTGAKDGLLRAISIISTHMTNKVIVPVEPTDEMIIAAKIAQRDWATSTDQTPLHKVIYMGMLEKA